jgi:hypothetical protein
VYIYIWIYTYIYIYIHTYIHTYYDYRYRQARLFRPRVVDSTLPATAPGCFNHPVVSIDTDSSSARRPRPHLKKVPADDAQDREEDAITHHTSGFTSLDCLSSARHHASPKC